MSKRCSLHRGSVRNLLLFIIQCFSWFYTGESAGTSAGGGTYACAVVALGIVGSGLKFGGGTDDFGRMGAHHSSNKRVSQEMLFDRFRVLEVRCALVVDPAMVR